MSEARNTLARHLTFFNQNRLEALEGLGVEVKKVDNISPTESHDQELARLLAQATSGLAQQVEDARRRLEAGTYGTCSGCGNKIGKARLKALPWAEFCLGCQEKKESETGHHRRQR